MFALASKTKVTAYFYLIYTFFRVSLPCSNTDIYYRTQDANRRLWTLLCLVIPEAGRSGVHLGNSGQHNSLTTDAKVLVDIVAK